MRSKSFAVARLRMPGSMMFMRSVGSIDESVKEDSGAVRSIQVARPGSSGTVEHAMPPRRQARAHGGDTVEVEVADHHAGVFVEHVDDFAPRVDQHAVAPGAAAVLVRAALRRGEHVALVLGRAGAQQDLPVRAARGVRERRRHDHQRAAVRAAHAAVQLGKAQIVADRQAHAAERRIEGLHLGAGPDGARLVERFGAFLEVEQVNLVVTRALRAARVEHERGVEHAGFLGRFQRQRAADDPYAVALRGIGEKTLDRAVAVGFADRELVGVLVAHEAEVLRQQHELRALRGGVGDQAFGFGEIARRIGRADHLQRRDAERGDRWGGRGGVGGRFAHRRLVSGRCSLPARSGGRASKEEFRDPDLNAPPPGPACPSYPDRRADARRGVWPRSP
ncbi:hypothetical protein PT2222_160149 [Paraburkholderia tropica]